MTTGDKANSASLNSLQDILDIITDNDVVSQKIFSSLRSTAYGEDDSTTENPIPRGLLPAMLARAGSVRETLASIAKTLQEMGLH